MTFAQPVANDDFYVIDAGPRNIETYLNDTITSGRPFSIVDGAFHGMVTWNNWDPFSCMYCPRYSPDANYTGFDWFQYRYNSPCCVNPPIPPPSNTATVQLIVIGNDDAQNAGSCKLRVPSDPGKPVNATNGNMWLEQRDYSLPGVGESIVINRFYNSIIQSSGLFGFGWSTQYDESIQIYGDKMIRYNQPDGRAAYFGRLDTNIPYKSFSTDVKGDVTVNGDGTFTLTHKDGRSRKFGSTGKLLSLEDTNGNETVLTYNGNGHLTTVRGSSFVRQKSLLSSPY